MLKSCWSREASKIELRNESKVVGVSALINQFDGWFDGRINFKDPIALP